MKIILRAYGFCQDGNESQWFGILVLSLAVSYWGKKYLAFMKFSFLS